MLDLIIRGGQVVTSDGVAQRDLGVQGGQIAAVAIPGTLEGEAGRTIDARGKVVLPGCIKPHTHITIPGHAEANVLHGDPRPRRHRLSHRGSPKVFSYL